MLRKTLRVLLLLYFITFAVNNISAQKKQNLRFSTISTDEGLSQGTVHSIIQDKEGFIWFATQDGLNKYDGYNFTIFNYNPNNNKSLSNNFILCLFEDSNGYIWIGTQGGGLNKFDKETRTFLRFSDNEKDTNCISGNTINSISEDNSGNIWIGTENNGITIINQSDKIIEKHIFAENNSNSLTSNKIKKIFKDSKNNIWVGTFGGGLNLYDSEKEKFKNISPENTKNLKFTELKINSIEEDTEGNLWIGTQENGLIKYSIHKNTAQQFIHNKLDINSISNNTVIAIHKDLQNELWIGTFGGGLCKYNKNTENFNIYKSHKDNSSGLVNNFIYSIAEDYGGTLWIGTAGDGICKLEHKKEIFALYQHTENAINSLSNSAVMSIYQSHDDLIWIGTFGGGVNILDCKTGEINYLMHNPNNQNSLSSNVIRKVFEDSNRNIWIGTHNSGLNKYNPLTGKFTCYMHIPDNNQSISSNEVYTLIEDSENNLWIGTNGGGLNKFNKENESFLVYKHDPNNDNTISHNNIYCLYEDSENNLWIGTRGGGLNMYDKTTNKFITYQWEENCTNCISHNFVLSIYDDLQGNLWIGTAGGGLNKFNKKTKQFTHFKEKDGLSNNVVYGVLGDKNESLWLSTNNGLCKFNPTEKIFKIYNKSDGLQGDEFNGGAFYKTKDGIMFFGGMNGLNSFHPKNIQDNNYKPPVVLTDFLLFNQSVKIGKENPNQYQLNKDITYTDKIVLDYTDYIFSFEFAALNYRQPDKNQYKYMLEGLDKKWIETDYKNRRATYTNLRHGEYIFRVIASNNDGVWNEEGISIKVKILPPFWKTWWFQALIILFIAGILIAFYLIRMRTIKKRNEELEQTVMERTTELRKSNELLKEKQSDLRIKQEEILAQNEEIAAQRDSIQEKNHKLEKLSIVASETNNAVIIMDEKGNFEWINESFTRMFGYTISDYKRENITNIFETSTNKNINSVYKQILEKKQAVVYESKIKKINGEFTWVQTTLTPILDENKKIKKLVAIESDITELKQAEQEITKQRDELQSKNELIQGSIKYAKTIQNAILTPKYEIDNYFENFIIYRPKDIVSGDFYLFNEINNQYYIAVVDCTGHGVPGAFMSMIGSRLINEIITEQQIHATKNILTELNKRIIKALRQTDGENRDGMDVCLVKITPKSNSTFNVSFSGAKRDLFFKKSNSDQIETIKGDRFSIGGYNINRDYNILFTSNQLSLSKNSIIYLTTDGYMDQNNPKRKRFGTKCFIRILKSQCTKSLDIQKQNLEYELDNWQSNSPQRDDITVLAVKL